MSNEQIVRYEDNILVYWFDFWTMESGIGLTVNASIEFYAKPNTANNMRMGSWVEVLTERADSFVIVKMPPSFIFEIDDYVSYDAFKNEFKKKNRREWSI
tara:strand:+ start:968 stop:1267 length:300 start_codon:yes stop_codon:yes gene_type:complete